jgi:hypothetical protein
MYAVPILAPIPLKVIVWKADAAVKEYHTSAPGVLVQLLETAGLETVAPAKVPPVLTQAEPGVMVTAPEQASLAGGEATVGSTIQTVKSVVEDVLAVILT